MLTIPYQRKNLAVSPEAWLTKTSIQATSSHVSSPRSPAGNLLLWALGAGLLAALVGAFCGEAVYRRFRPMVVMPANGASMRAMERQAYFAGQYEVQKALVETKNTALAYGILGAALSGALGLAAGLARRRSRSAFFAALIGSLAGAVAAPVLPPCWPLSARGSITWIQVSSSSSQLMRESSWLSAPRPDWPSPWGSRTGGKSQVRCSAAPSVLCSVRSSSKPSTPWGSLWSERSRSFLPIVFLACSSTSALRCSRPFSSASAPETRVSPGRLRRRRPRSDRHARLAL